MRAALATWFAKGIAGYLPEIRCRLPVEADQKQVYLTFDDGPTLDGTPRILDVLDRLNVTATFFLVGKNAVAHPSLVRAIQQAGHTIGSHSHQHLDAWRASAGAVMRDLTNGMRAIEDVIGSPVKWMRPPFGRITRAVVRWSRRNGQQILLWDILPADFSQGTTRRRIVRQLTAGLRAGSVICLHDNAKALRITPDALEIALPQLLDAGWKFAPVK
ncbi:MAG: polysaccharide deacetylase family protein [Planctomycetaceae bacterium]